MQFEFATATQIIFGRKTSERLPDIAKSFGKKLLLVFGKEKERIKNHIDTLEKNGFELSFLSITKEPTVEDAINGVTIAKQNNVQCIIGFGGGSAIDTAKAISGLAANEGDVFEYLEVIGKGKPLQKPAIPCIAIPTTSGPGTEVTKNAVVASYKHQFKVSIRHLSLLPRVALVDPELTFTLPKEHTINTGLDAFTQVLEPFTSSKANPFTDSICLEAIRRISSSIVTAVNDGYNAAAREDMSLGSVFGGLALANSGLGAVHGFAAPLGGMYQAPHGAVCAALLPHVMQVNIRALRSRNPKHISIAKYEEIARCITKKSSASAEDGIQWISSLCEELEVKRLREYNIKKEDFAEISKKATQSSSMKANPLPLLESELLEILERAW